MNKSIKSLITETEKELSECKLVSEELKIGSNYMDYFDKGASIKLESEEYNDLDSEAQCVLITMKLAYLKALKLCQEIQDAKVKELKDKIQNEQAHMNNSDGKYCGKCVNVGKVEEIIDKIFGEETQAVGK
jgi:hypothetical protein